MALPPPRNSSGLSPELSLARISGTLQVVLILGGTGVLLWLLDGLILELFVVAMLSLLLRGLGEAVARGTRMPMGLSVAVVTIVIIMLCSFGVYFRGPRFVSEMAALYSKLGPLISNFNTRYGRTPWGHFIISHLTSSSMALEKPAMSFISTGFGLLGTILIVLLAAVYIAAMPGRYLNGTILLFPPTERSRVAQVMRDCGHALQWWMLGQAIDMVAVAAISTTGLIILQVPPPYALGIQAGLLTFIPYFGAWIGSIPAVLIALTVNVHCAIWTIVLFLICHLVEGYVLAPIVQRRAVDLPPAVTLLSMSVAGSFYGLPGIALATPIAAVALVIVQELYVARLESR
jgi:predicted PurR-regulated permease PerM